MAITSALIAALTSVGAAASAAAGGSTLGAMAAAAATGGIVSGGVGAGMHAGKTIADWAGGTAPWDKNIGQHLSEVAGAVPFVGGLVSNGIDVARGQEVSGKDWGIAGGSLALSAAPVLGAGLESAGGQAFLNSAVEAIPGATEVVDTVGKAAGKVSEWSNSFEKILKAPFQNIGSVAQRSGAANAAAALVKGGGTASNELTSALTTGAVSEALKKPAVALGNILATPGRVVSSVTKPLSELGQKGVSSLLGPKASDFIGKISEKVVPGAAKSALLAKIAGSDPRRAALSGAAGGLISGGLRGLISDKAFAPTEPRITANPNHQSQPNLWDVPVRQNYVTSGPENLEQNRFTLPQSPFSQRIENRENYVTPGSENRLTLQQSPLSQRLEKMVGSAINRTARGVESGIMRSGYRPPVRNLPQQYHTPFGPRRQGVQMVRQPGMSRLGRN